MSLFCLLKPEEFKRLAL
jgi:hypothetical protein